LIGHWRKDHLHVYQLSGVVTKIGGENFITINNHVKKYLGANEITRTTPTYFFTTFGEIFLEYFWNIFEKIFEKIF
jgi:hypothetical protein